jgi:hypothetical protein
MTTQPKRAGGKKAAAPARKAATPWGPAAVLEEVRVAQRAGDKRFASVFELLEGSGGEQLVRIAYSTDGVSRRGPVTLRARDLERLHAALAGSEGLAAALGWKEAGA